MEIAITVQETEDAIAQARDFQMIRVSKEMLDIIRDDSSTTDRKAKEVTLMNNKLQHARRARDMILTDRVAGMSKIPQETDKIKVQNQILAQRIEEIEAKNQQRE